MSIIVRTYLREFEVRPPIRSAAETVTYPGRDVLLVINRSKRGWSVNDCRDDGSSSSLSSSTVRE